MRKDVRCKIRIACHLEMKKARSTTLRDKWDRPTASGRADVGVPGGRIRNLDE